MFQSNKIQWFIAALLGAAAVAVAPVTASKLVGVRFVNTAVTSKAAPKSATVAPVVTAVSDEDKLVNVIQQALPSVVNIVISSADQNGVRTSIASGTGFVVNSDGLILTNRHVVDFQNALYRVYFTDGRRYDATVVAEDPLEDVALVKINGDKLPVLTLGDSDNIKIGQTAIAIGNSLGLYPNTVTRGIISGIGRSITAGSDVSGQSESLDDVIQTDAEINPGNSGGPLLNSKGEVVGIDTAIEQDGRGVGFALPINEAKITITSYTKTGKVVRPYLGVRYVTITPDIQDEKKLAYNYGALIDAGDGTGGPAIVPGSPADAAGLQAGDIILSVNDQLVRGDATLFKIVQKYTVGDILNLKVYRAGALLPIAVTLQQVPAATP